MRRVDYRIERIPVNAGEPRLLLLVERLAELGRHGWHVASADIAPRPGHEQEPLTVLLERELDEHGRPGLNGDRGDEMLDRETGSG